MATPITNVTTSSMIEGWDIKAHLGVVAAHVVAGTGLMSEFFAGWSDLFGGRSGSYQNQLASIYTEALKHLLRQAGERGGNWIAGLSVDFDEISGKGTQMFMVSATGTAVRAERTARAGETTPGGTGRPVGSADLEIMQRRLALGDAVREGRLVLDDATWAFIVEHHVEEVISAVLRWVGERIPTGGKFEDLDVTVRQRPLAYFRGLTPDVAASHLYEALAGEGVAAKAALALIQAVPLVQLETTLVAIRGSEPAARRALQALKAQQPSYGPADLALLDALITSIPQAFPERAARMTTKGLLGAREVWTCGFCGKKGNDEGDTHCKACWKDPAGFLREELTALSAVTMLTQRRRALAMLLNGTS